MKYTVILALLALWSSTAVGQKQQYTTPVPILKQINRHNEDGSYSYGYEAADGTFKIETKYPDGEVYGKYGYVEDTGNIRQVEYGASRRGFEPAGSGINVPPPTLKSGSPVSPLQPDEEDDGQYREDPSVYYKNEVNNDPPKYQSQYQSQFQSQNQPQQYQPQSIYQSKYQSQPQYEPKYQPQPQYQPKYQPQPQPAFRPQFQPTFQQPAYRPQANYNPAPGPVYNWRGSPASNVDLVSGSYSVQY